MKLLKTLIKLRKQELDNLLISINNLESQNDQLNLFLQNLEAEAKKESEYYSGTEYAFMLAKYLNSVKNSKNHLVSQIIEVTKQIKLSQNQLHDKFIELKKFEFTLQNRVTKERNGIKKAETKVLDELNTNKVAFNKQKSSI